MFASFALWGNTNPGEYDWTVSSSEYSEDQDAITDALSSADALTGAGVVGSRTTKSFIHSMFYIYEHENTDLVANIATAANIQTFCEIESKLTLLDGYPEVRGGRRAKRGDERSEATSEASREGGCASRQAKVLSAPLRSNIVVAVHSSFLSILRR
jgi:hypothetical protein